MASEKDRKKAKKNTVKYDEAFVKKLTKVTEQNKRFAIVIGRRTYVVGGLITCNSPDIGMRVIYPRRRANHTWVEEGMETFLKEDEPVDEYHMNFLLWVDKFLWSGKLYINLDEPLVDVAIKDKKGNIITASKVVKIKEAPKVEQPKITQTGFNL